VHPDRPLACRVYPLARSVSPDGEESFGHLTPHPRPKASMAPRGPCRTISITSNSRHSLR
jgi:hypothetical protein